MARAAVAVLGLIITFYGILFFKGMSSQGMKVSTGFFENNQLRPCPDKPNCVYTKSKPEDEEHYIAPLRVRKETYVLKNQLKVIGEKMNFKLINEDESYLYFTFQSKLMGFVDDIEFFVDNGYLHAKSASRVGHSDLGANRERIEKIFEEMEKLEN